jgi:hypothetical protein
MQRHPEKLLKPLSNGSPKRLCSRPAWRKRFRVQHKTFSLPLPRHESRHPAPACQPASQTDVIDAHNMAINCTPMEYARQDPDRTTLSAYRGDSTGVLTVLWRFPPYSAKPIPQLISFSHFASYPAFSFPSLVVRLTLPSNLHASSLSFLPIRYFNLIRFNRAHLHPFARLRHTFFVRPTNFASSNSIIPYFEPTFDCIVISTASIQLFSTAIDI